jgi:hypothetical protein
MMISVLSVDRFEYGWYRFGDVSELRVCLATGLIRDHRSWWPPCYMKDKSIEACRIEACMQVCSAPVLSRRQRPPGVALSYLSDDNDLSASPNLAPREYCRM